MDIARILQILNACHVHSLRKEEEPPEGFEVVEVWPRMAVLVEAAREHGAEMIELLKEWPSESWGHPVPPLGQELNYLVVGGVLDSQGRAFQLFAFGKVLGWWEILNPVTVLGLSWDDPMAGQLAGAGMIAISGYKPDGVEPQIPRV
jgi:hypothetical protein